MITLVKADICTIEADAIVNAANETLEGGGGVDGCIHAMAGPQLLEKCREFPIKPLQNSKVVDVGRCDVGEVIVTPSYQIKTCSYIFHTVSPILDENGNPNDNHLRLCYQNCLNKASEMHIEKIAFCCIGTGFYGFPHERAAFIAVETAKLYPNLNIIFSVIDDIDSDSYQKLLMG